MTISITKFEIGKEYRRNNDGKSMSAIPFTYVVTARSNSKVTLLEVNINGGFRFELEREITTDCNGNEYAFISEYEGNICSNGLASVPHMTHERNNELREIIKDHEKNSALETFHAKLIEYDNACKVTDLHSTHADTAGMADDTIRSAWAKAYYREQAILLELRKLYILIDAKAADNEFFTMMITLHRDELIKATA